MKINVTNREFAAMLYARDTWIDNCSNADIEYCNNVRPDIKAMQRLINKYKMRRNELMERREKLNTTTTSRGRERNYPK